MKTQLEKLIEYFKPKTKEDGETPSSIGIHIINRDEMIEVTVNKDLKIDYSDTYIYIDADNYIGMIKIDRIEEITEI